MKEKISNTIFLKQQSINELQEIKERVKKTCEKEIRFKVETKHWYGFSDPHLIKNKNILNISKCTMLKILDKAIEEERNYIDKLIDMEIDTEIKNRGVS